MRVLVFADQPPLTTRASGDVRFAALIQMICDFAEVTFCTLPHWLTPEQAHKEEVNDSIAHLERIGCEFRTDVLNLIRQGQFDVILFEFYDTALRYLDEARYYQPAARIVIDSVDLHFRRFLAKSELEKTSRSRALANKVRLEELSIYGRSDSVIMVTQEDVDALRIERPGIHAGLIPNIHDVPDLVEKHCGDKAKLIFIGGFRHAPNEDAVLYFANDIWPLVKKRLPGASITVIGENPPLAIKEIAAPDFHVLGHVPDIRPFLDEADISVAPLRWGGGIKGKVGEAMAHGLPVVTTSIGAEGFGLVSQVHAIVADDPNSFADGIVSLANDRELFMSVRKAGHALVNGRFSGASVRHKIEDYFNAVLAQPTKHLSALKFIKFTALKVWRQHMAWRLG